MTARPNPGETRFDYVIVGAGSAGCVIANRLTEDPAVSVLLLEAGGPDTQFYYRLALGFHSWRYPETNWAYESEPEPHLQGRRIALPRGKVLGGSSTMNAMLYSRGHPRDYDGWREMGCEGWGYADVLPYFRRSETNWRGEGPYHGGSGPLQVSAIDTRNRLHEPVMEAARHLGYPTTEDHHGRLHEGFGRGDTTTTARGRRSSASKAYLDPVRSRPNLTVVPNALATRVSIEGGRATGVMFRTQGIERAAHASREIILTAGVYNTPQLLMLSGIGPGDHLRQVGISPVVDLPGVGRNLAEHAGYWIDFETRGPISLLKELRFDKVAIAALQWAVFGKGLLASQVNSAHAEIRSQPGISQPDLQIYFNPVRPDARPWFPGVGRRQEHKINAVVCLLNPQSRGWTQLRCADPAVKPRITLNLMATARDRDTLVRSVRLVRELYDTPSLRGLIAREVVPGPLVRTDEEIESYLRGALITTHHSVGTCMMGHGPLAVVDPDLKVQGVAGLRVCDASIMPTVPGGNTNAPTIMIAEKASDLIRGRQLAPLTVPIDEPAPTPPR